MKFYFDSQGYPFLDIYNEYHVLADFLSGDIQRSLFGVNEYITACDNVTSGVLDIWSGAGNAHTVTIKKGGVNIFNEYTEEELQIKSVDEFKSYLGSWKELLLNNGVSQ